MRVSERSPPSCQLDAFGQPRSEELFATQLLAALAFELAMEIAALVGMLQLVNAIRSIGGPIADTFSPSFGMPQLAPRFTEPGPDGSIPLHRLYPRDRIDPRDRFGAIEGASNLPSSQHSAYATGYYPANNAMEGGHFDRKGAPLQTLQDYVSGRASYVSIALDKRLYQNGAVRHGDVFRIPELEKKYGMPIVFRAVDTGGAFTGRGFGRVDICTRGSREADDVTGPLTLVRC